MARWSSGYWLGRWTRDGQIVGSISGRYIVGQQPWASCSHVPLFTKQYNLVPCEGFQGALKMLDVKMTDVKLTDQCAGHENAGHENARHEIAGQEPHMKLRRLRLNVT